MKTPTWSALVQCIMHFVSCFINIYFFIKKQRYEKKESKFKDKRLYTISYNNNSNNNNNNNNNNDSLHPPLLLSKLKAYGFEDNTIKLFESYLRDRGKLC